MKVEFEWRISEPDAESGGFFVLERLCGTDLQRIYGPMAQGVAESFIKARRSFVHRTITTRTKAIQLFEPRATNLTKH